MPLRSHFLGALAVLLLIAVPSGLLADTGSDNSGTQLLFIGVDPQADAPGDLPADLPIIAIDTLPTEDAAQQAIFAARLRSSPVSTFVSKPDEAYAQFEQFFLVSAVDLLQDGDGYQIALGGEKMSLGAFSARVSAAVSAFNPEHRRIGFLRVADPEDVFPLAIEQVQAALGDIGFDLMVLMIGIEDQASGCDGTHAQAPHFSVISGLADRAPFGNGDGISTSAEVEGYLGRALNRQISRDPACGPKYSLLIKSGSDPDQELVAYKGRSAFADMETQLYTETFEAMFLMESKDKNEVEAFLTACLYCPNERALTDRLRDMEEFTRASALEGDIWQRIKDDSSPDRLAIYLENCALCAYRTQVEGRIEEIEAIARAAGGEKQAFEAAHTARNVEALRSYVSSCIACAFVPKAESEIARLEADAEYQTEQANLAAALDGRDLGAMQTYLDGCKICSGRDEVQVALANETKRLKFSQPCLDLAAVPQLGGPRKLEDIDQDQARSICETAAVEFPEDGLIRTTLGRIAQAAGDFDTAKASYSVGMEAGVPSAFGLAAYSHYAPPLNTEIDLAAVEALAVKGAEQDDWLSQEILTVLYSKNLIPGKTPEDAFRIAEHIAAQGNPLAQFFVGYYYLTGSGVAQSDSEASVWLSKSVGQGYTHAYSFLAELHEKGVGPDASPETAADLYWEALIKGDPNAADRLTTQIRSRDRAVVRIIQQKLRDEGAYRGSVDGVPGKGTVAAIRSFANSFVVQG